MPAASPTRFRTLARSVRLFRSFRLEQSQPEVFYRELARDTVRILQEYTATEGAIVLDVGSGPVQFAQEFSRVGARYVGLDVDVHTVPVQSSAATIAGVGEHLPFADASVDIVMSSNVMEHVPQPGLVAQEMLRVVRPGGVVFISYTAWYSLWGGHETSPWHFLGGARAARWYERRHGHPPKNRFGTSMYAAFVGQGLAWARRQTGARVLFAGPRYHPDWATWVVHVPGVREVATWNLLIVLRRTP